MDTRKPLHIQELPPHIGAPVQLELNPAGLGLVIAITAVGEDDGPAMMLRKDQARELFNWLGVWLVR